jgi:hypothetical protein
MHSPIFQKKEEVMKITIRNKYESEEGLKINFITEKTAQMPG